jgi:hypothetical protein
MLAECFAKAGLPHQADVLRALLPIQDMHTLRDAEKTLTGLEIPRQPTETVASFFTTASTLKKLANSMDLYACCFLNVMASRFAYNDDRSVDEMRRDLLAATP